MPIRINFDTANIPEKPTLVLAKRDGTKLGQVRAQALKIKDSNTDIPELYFEIYKYINGEKEPLWDDIDNFKLIWIKESDIWFDVQININESNEIKKTVTCNGLGHSELSQIYLYETEINTENDIARDDYVVTVLYDENNPDASLLNRVLEKAPHYSIAHVDSSIQGEQRTFSFNGTTICDAFTEIGEELECIFDIHIGSDENGNILRQVNVYDLLNYCTKCGYREASMTICPKCNSTNILEGYGKDTTIFVTSDELASEISSDSDVDSVKNCFRLTAGDDLMTAVIRDCNPNGSSYIWYIPEYMRKEMSDELQEQLLKYDELFNKYQTNTTDETLIAKINDWKIMRNHYAIYSGQPICRLNGRDYIAVCNKDEGFAIGGWISTPAGNDMWNYPFICTTDKDTWSYYYIDNPDSDIPVIGTKTEIANSIIINGQTWYYNSNSSAYAGNIGNENDRGFYLGIFNSEEEAAEFFIGNYLNGNSYNLLAHKYNSMLTQYENDKNIADCYKHSEILKIPECIYNYPNLMEAYYNTIDMKLFLESTLSPPANLEEVSNDINEQIAIIESLNNLGSTPDFAVQTNDLLSTSEETLLLAAKNYIKYHISSNYKIDVTNGGIYKSDTIIPMIITVTIEPYSSLSEEESLSTGIRLVACNDNETYIKNRIDSILSNVETNDSVDISSLFEKDIDEFQYLLMFFSYNQLESFADACQSCLDILITQGVNTQTDGNLDIYNNIYLPYYYKNVCLNNELSKRQAEINSIAVYDDEGELCSGIQYDIIKERDRIRLLLNFQNFIGEQLWKEFCTYRREDEYSNSNYISDGLDNAELLKKAMEFIEKANKEIHKAAIVQHTISTTLKNLLVINKFQPLVEHFEVGNWIRVQIDEIIYKLRLVSYEIDYDNLENISVEFSDATTSIDGYTDIQDIISRAESMASSYDYVSRQAKQGEDGKKLLNNWVEVGLDATNVKFIGGADNQTQTWDEHGMVFKAYNPLEDTYDDRQLKIINHTISITDDNWKHIRTAIGRFLYQDPETNNLIETYGINGETIVGKLILGEQLGIYNSENTLKFDKNGLYITSNQSDNNVNISINPNSDSIFSLKNGDDNIFYVDNNGNGVFTGTINAKGGTIGGWTIAENGFYDISGGSNCGVGLNHYDGSNYAFYAGATKTTGSDVPSSSDAPFRVSFNGKLYASAAEITGTIYAKGGTVGGWTIDDQQIYKDTYVRSFDNVDSYSGGASVYRTAIQAYEGTEEEKSQDSYGAVNARNSFYVYANKWVNNDHWEFSHYTFYVNNRGELFTKEAWIDGNIKIDGNATINATTTVNGSFYMQTMLFDTSENAFEGTTAVRNRIASRLGIELAAWDYKDANSIFYNIYLRCNRTYIHGNLSSQADAGSYSLVVRNAGIHSDGVINSPNGFTQTSDENYKSIFELDDRYEHFFNELKPILYKYDINDGNIYHRKHMGFGARAVRTALETAEIDTEDFVGLVIEKNTDVVTGIDADELYTLRYDEFISLNTYMIQKTRKQLSEALKTMETLQNQINELKAMVN